MNATDLKRTFDRWLAEHRGLLFKVVRAHAATPHEQDDLFQEIAVRLWKSIPRYRGEAAETTWIYRVALFTAISWSRREKKHRSEPLDGHEPVLTAAGAPPDERLDWLYQQIRRLDDVDRSLTLLMLDGFSYREIAATLGISKTYVGVKIHRIKKQLTARLATETGDGV